MRMAARGLGKGLDSLIPNTVGEAKVKKEAQNVAEPKAPETFVKITKVEPNREQPRKNFDEDALLELSESIKQFGVLQPLLVQDKNGYYEIIAGERRWRAAKLAGIKEIPVIIKELTEQEVVEIALIENIQRENLNPIEEAIAYKRLLTEFNLKQD
jgi:ParB family chromosome partitioning protein